MMDTNERTQLRQGLDAAITGTGHTLLRQVAKERLLRAHAVKVELDELREENVRQAMTREIEAAIVAKELDELRQENARLRAENEQLRALRAERCA